MGLTRHELSQRAIDLVAAWSDGSPVKGRGQGYHVDSPTHGRVRVHARSRASSSLIWFNVPEPAGDRYHTVVLIEFDADARVADAWKLSAAEVIATATSATLQHGNRILKIPVGGEWTGRAPRVDLTD